MDVRDVERRPWGKSFLKPKGAELESGRVFLFVLDLLPRFTYVKAFLSRQRAPAVYKPKSANQGRQ
jgi:hypothetical protein